MKTKMLNAMSDFTKLSGQTHIKKKVCIDESVLCHDGLHCVEKAKFCDGQIDCSDFSDELFCGELFTLL